MNEIDIITCGMPTEDVRQLLNQLIQCVNSLSDGNGNTTVYPMQSTRLEIPKIATTQYPTVTAINSDGRLSAVKVDFTADKIIIETTPITFKGVIIIKN